MLLILTAALLATQVQTSATVGRDSTGRREVGVRIQVGRAPGDEPVRRVAVTAEHLATAFKTPAARTLLTRARAARFSQDTALRSYDAKARQRISVGMSVRARGRERLVMRDEAVARIQWDHKAGAVVDMLGKRTTVPAADDMKPVDEGIRNDPSLPIPYFPGRETLWIGGSVARVEVNEENFVHPIAEGSEAYYKYSMGDSVEFTLPDNRTIMLRELRAEAREPRWNLIVGSFWFDQASAQLVRAVYRPSIELDIWQLVTEEAKRDSSNNDDDVPGWVKGLVSPLRAVMQVFTIEYSLFEGRFWLPVSMGAEGKLQVTFLHVPAMFEERYDYAHVNGPVNVAAPMAAVPAPPMTVNTGTLKVLRDSVLKAGRDSVAADSVISARYGFMALRREEYAAEEQALRDSLRRAGVPPRTADSIMVAQLYGVGLSVRARRAVRDSLASLGRSQQYIDSVINYRFDTARERADARRRARRDTVGAQGFTGTQVDSVIRVQDSTRNARYRDSVRTVQDSTCKANGHVARRIRQYEQRVDILVRTPCDLQSLANSPELPPSPYETGEDLWGKKDRDKLLGALDFALQAGWGPQKISASYGLSQSRYNRVEGFSTGLLLRQELGRGYTWSAQLRGSQGDKQFNGELGLSRSNARSTLALNGYRRLVSANDWGQPHSLSASLPALLYARDEGFYYRALGGELTRSTDFHGQVVWRVFAEEHSDAPLTTRFSLFRGSHDDRFIPNLVATEGAYYGGSVRWQQSWGLNPRGWKSQADFRLEGAGGETDYGRAALDLTVSRGLFDPYVVGLTVAGGSSLGDVPPQRQWILGSIQTVRGQQAGVAAGDAFWFSRLELAQDKGATRRAIFGDLGWAGSRDADWGRSQRLLAGVGVGASFFEGLVRFDIARGLWPREKWRVDLSLDAPF
ncbi:MAG TPA: hypothetical protein VJR92_07130 [Gemmatimonadaceae bacterium]|nr:hypothetical protein [Gemmatimonadaceae bacterium]